MGEDGDDVKRICLCPSKRPLASKDILPDDARATGPDGSVHSRLEAVGDCL